MEQSAIHEKGFNMYGMIKTNSRRLEDAILNDPTQITKTKQENKYKRKPVVLKALYEKNLEELRNISEYFARTDGIYSRALKYLSSMYRYDWYIVPEIYDQEMPEAKVLGPFNKITSFFDNSYVKKLCNELALKTVKYGVYYGYSVETKDSFMLQDLPIKYCRSRYSSNSRPVVEFNMKYFDETFPDVGYRMRVLKLFPKDFQKGYSLFKQGKLMPDNLNDKMAGCWYTLDPEYSVKFTLTDDEFPFLVNAIPSILDLEESQGIDRRRQLQKLLKILVQKLPLDKNGELIFDLEEAADIHNNAVEMLANAVGVDVLTTFADVTSIDTTDRAANASSDELEKAERTVYNELGISKNLFNAEGNLSLTQSISNDEGTLRSLLLQFQAFFDMVAKRYYKNRKCRFRLYMLETTQYNYKELSKLYKEQVQIGYSKMLPQIALGHSQSSIINTAYFENKILHLTSIMIPPLMSSVLNGDVLKDIANDGEVDNDTTDAALGNEPALGVEKDQGGRPELEDSEKSDKTLQNIESQN